MPYFPEIEKLAEQVGLWADLRHEQGIDVSIVVRNVSKQLAAASKRLETLKIPVTQIKDEPNDLMGIRRLRPRGPRKLCAEPPYARLRSKLEGAWLARAAGCTLGCPVEAWTIDAMEQLAKAHHMEFPPKDYWAGHPAPETIRYENCKMSHYLRGRVKYIPVDDDLTYTLLGLLILEDHGPRFTTKDVAAAWIKYLPIACTAEDITLQNLKSGISATRAGAINNPYSEWIGADIRSDPWGYAAPGWPERAAEMAYRDAILSHRRNGVYGAMFFAAAIAAAFVVDDPIEALKVGLTEIPKNCRLARDLRWALKLGPTLKDWRAARASVDKRFAGMHCVHTNNNACLTVFGLILGRQDMTATLGQTVAMGLDNDCTAATAGSILGAIVGKEGVPKHWHEPFRNKTRTYMNGRPWFSNSDIVTRFTHAARRVWQSRRESSI